MKSIRSSSWKSVCARDSLCPRVNRDFSLTGSWNIIGRIRMGLDVTWSTKCFWVCAAFPLRWSRLMRNSKRVYWMSSSLLGSPLSILTLLIFLVRKKSKVSCSMLDRLTPPGLLETIVTVLPTFESSTGSHITPCT